MGVHTILVITVECSSGMASRLYCLEDSDKDSDEETGNYVNQDMVCSSVGGHCVIQLPFNELSIISTEADFST